MKMILLSTLLLVLPSPAFVMGLWWSGAFLSLSMSVSVSSSSAFTLAQDNISSWMLLLSIWITSLMTVTQFFANLKEYLGKVLIVLFLSLIMVFSSPDLILMYFFFEVSLIPIFFIVLGWGYQPERLSASMFLFFYTLFASLPLILFILMLLDGPGHSMFLMSSQTSTCFSGLLFFSGVLAFLVKFPVFGVHMWLPKAHVEAPVSGSMILAGALLKLGGYGMLRFSPSLSTGEPFSITMLMILGGAGIISILCVSSSDMKIVIALSSVVHMALIAVSFKWGLFTGREGGIMIMLSHGVCSSGLFAVANSFYERSHSRSLILNKGAATNMPQLVPMFFVLTMANFGGPFTLNLLGELLMIINLNYLNWALLMSLLFLSFFSAAYSLILFSSITQGQLAGPASAGGISTSRELSITMGHCWPLGLSCAAPFFS